MLTYFLKSLLVVLWLPLNLALFLSDMINLLLITSQTVLALELCTLYMFTLLSQQQLSSMPFCQERDMWAPLLIPILWMGESSQKEGYLGTCDVCK